jgi:GT2 family glycosyltransferase
MMVRRSALKDTPLLNKEYFMYAEEKDLALRLKHKGYNTYFVPGGEIIHHGGKSTGQESLPMFLELQKSQVKFYKKYHSPLKAFMLNASWWLVLFSNFMISMPLSLVGRNRSRFSLLKTAIIKYPQYMRTL